MANSDFLKPRSRRCAVTFAASFGAAVFRFAPSLSFLVLAQRHSRADKESKKRNNSLLRLLPQISIRPGAEVMKRGALPTLRLRSARRRVSVTRCAETMRPCRLTPTSSHCIISLLAAQQVSFQLLSKPELYSRQNTSTDALSRVTTDTRQRASVQQKCFQHDLDRSRAPTRQGLS